MKKTIAGLIIIVLIALVSYNYDAITGFMVRPWQIQGQESYRETQINIEPEQAKAGQRINIEIIPGNKGAEKTITIHSSNGAKKDSTREWCNIGYEREEIRSATKIMHSFKCSEPKTFSYRIPASFKPGDYYIRIYDYAKAKENKCASKHGREYEACAYAIAWFTVTA